MAVTASFSEQFLYEILKHLDSPRDLKVCLMNTTFAYDPETHAKYSDISADEIATGYGYTQKTKALANVAVSIDAGNGRVQIDCDSPTWTATGDVLPAIGSAVIIDDDHADDVVVCCIDFGVDYITLEDTMFMLNCNDGLAEATGAILS